MQLLDGKKTASDIRADIKVQVAELKENGFKVPHLAAVIVGDDGASQTYVASKVKQCAEVGFESTLIKLPDTISEEALLAQVESLNNNESIDGFIVQLPLPEQIDEQKVTEAVAPEKDVDGFHPESVGKMVLGLPTYLPATPYGILNLIDRYNIKTEGMHCVVLGRSNIVGSPMSILMARNTQPGNCTVTVYHSRSKNIRTICNQADILIVALGRPEFVKSEMVKEGAIVIDVGITRVKDSTKKSGYRLLGDVDFGDVAEKCSYITPVPGGVGPMTIASLLLNTLQASKGKRAVVA